MRKTLRIMRLILTLALAAAIVGVIWQRLGPRLEDLPDAAVKPKPEGNTVTNVLSVRAEPDSVRFLVTSERITAFARADLNVDGPFGFRIGKGVNLHITNLDVTRRLAPFPARR